jgi:hypothetical protein
MAIRKTGKSYMVDVVVAGQRVRKLIRKRQDAVRIHQILAEDSDIFVKVAVLERIIRDLKALALRKTRGKR